MNGLRLDWRAGGIFVTPSWTAVDHEAGEESDLFVLGVRPVLQALHLRREQEDAEPQTVLATFEPRREPSSGASSPGELPPAPAR